MTELVNFIIESLFLGLLIWFALRLLTSWLIRRGLKRLEELDNEIDEINQSFKRAKVEEYHGIFYVFDADSDEFIGQGRTLAEFAQHLRNDLTIQLVEGDPDVISRFRNSATESRIE
jgi:hypothetical protein